MSGVHDPRFIQHVTATAGFAYGVIGADMHLLGTGTPLYVLANHDTGAPADSAWLIEVPSRMLDARNAVVTFTGRATELAKLHTWRMGGGPRMAGRWLHAPGGQGKTRLANQLAAAATADSWKVVAATHGPGTALPPPGSQDLRLDHHAGLLLIVDYADRWPASHLNWLLSNALLHQPGIPTRILMLARAQTMPPAIDKTLTDLRATVSHQLLEPLPADGDRAGMFTAARDGFAAHYPAADVAAVSPPTFLDHADLGLTLAIHMAALVAVDAHVHGLRRPTDPAGLTSYLLAREYDHWNHLYTQGCHDGRPTGLDHTTPPSVMAQAVFTAVLTGPVNHPTGKGVLVGLDLETHPARVLTDHAHCYPPPGSTHVLQPLHPDRLAEDYLAAATSRYPWAPTTATTLLARDSGGTAPAWTPRAVTFLAAAAHRHPDLAETILYPLLRTDP
ncbi:MAG: hypothetical protein HYR62_06010 [Actinobacteria bacterium]|nr:hypothetical protein [Actinomycetota bacterium]